MTKVLEVGRKWAKNQISIDIFDVIFKVFSKISKLIGNSPKRAKVCHSDYEFLLDLLTIFKIPKFQNFQNCANFPYIFGKILIIF